MMERVVTKCKVLVDKLVVNELLITQNVNHEAKTPHQSTEK